MFKMDTESEMIIAVLHDIMKDCKGITAYYLKKEGFVEDIVNTLIVLNRHNYIDYEAYICEVAKNLVARKVKMVDIMDNINVLRLDTVDEKDLQRSKKYHWAYNYLKINY